MRAIVANRHRLPDLRPAQYQSKRDHAFCFLVGGLVCPDNRIRLAKPFAYSPHKERGQNTTGAIRSHGAVVFLANSLSRAATGSPD